MLRTTSLGLSFFPFFAQSYGISDIQTTNDALAEATVVSVGGTIINTTGSSEYGVYATSASGAATATSVGVDTNTTGANAHAIYAYVSGLSATKDAFVSTDSNITTTGADANGIYAYARGSGNSTATATNNIINVTGVGVYAHTRFGAGNATATLNGGSIISGNTGILARTVTSNIAGSGTATAEMNGGTIDAGGHGIHAKSSGEGAVVAKATATSANDYIKSVATGIYAQSMSSTATAISDGVKIESTNGNGLHAWVSVIYPTSDAFASTNSDVIALASGVVAESRRNTTATAENNVITAGETGVRANSTEGTSLAETTNAQITAGQFGVYATSLSDSNAVMNGGSVDAGSHGIYTFIFGSGNATSTMNSGIITAGGNGVYAKGYRDGYDDNTWAQALGTGSITAVGHGVYASSYLGTATVNSEDVAVETTGNAAHGLFAEIKNATATSDATITTHSQITTNGAASHGIYALNRGAGVNQLTLSDGTLVDVTAGAGSDAVRTESQNGYTLAVSGSTLKGGTATGAAIHTISPVGGSVDLDNTTIVDGSLSGVAFRDGDANADGTDETLGDTILTTAANMTGDVLMNDGSDTVNYLGGTINGNLNGGDDLDTADNWIDTLNITGIEVNATALPTYLNFEDVNILSSTIDFGDSYTSPESINFTVDENSTIIMTGGGAGDYTINANVENNGLFDFVDGTVGDHLTITGHDTANGDLTGTGTFAFDTDFYTKQSDYITVNGNVTANGTIAINDVTSYSYDDYSNTDAGLSESTQASSGAILLIEAPNDSDKSDEDFNLIAANQYNGEGKLGRFTGNPFVWALGTSGNDWVLTYASDIRPEYIEPTIVAEIPAYTSLPTIGREIVMDELGTLHTRLGELRNNQGWVGTGDSNLKTNLGSEWHNAIGFDDSKANAWLKGTISHFDISSDNSFDVSGTYGGFNLGIDKKFDLGNSSPDWSVFTGLFGGYKTGEFETSGKGNQYTSNEHADIDIDAWSIGGYATFFNTAGTYIDLVAEYMDFSADIDAAGLNSSTDGYALAGSIEVGHSFDLAKDWIIEPQAQVKLAHINWDDFNDSVNDVSFEDHTYVTGRAGARVEKTITTSIGEIKPWAYMGVLHEFTDAPEVTYADTIFEAVDYNTAGEIKLGITADIYKSTQLYSDIGYAIDFNDYNSVKGDLGLRITW